MFGQQNVEAGRCVLTDKVLRRLVDLTHEIRLVQVTVMTVIVHGHVNVANVALLPLVRIRDPVANHLRITAARANALDPQPVTTMRGSVECGHECGCGWCVYMCAMHLVLMLCISLNKFIHTGSGDGYRRPPLFVQVNENIL